ncbi:MAG: helix-turn-helix domain-containing protein [Deltaproteobacteria bacterium]|nr:helix-turn-helix domain-containing protein [Deltaproteobacteria bacterium]
MKRMMAGKPASRETEPQPQKTKRRLAGTIPGASRDKDKAKTARNIPNRSTRPKMAGERTGRRRNGQDKKQPIVRRGGIVYPIPSRRILDSLRKDAPNGCPKGEAIKAFREAINLNMREFAFFIGVDPATVFRWETSRTGKLQSGSMSKVLKLVNSVAAGKPVKIPSVARLFS